MVGVAEAEFVEGAPEAPCSAEPAPEPDALEEGCAAADEPVLPDEGSVEDLEEEALEGACAAAEEGAVDGVCLSAELSDIGAAELGAPCWPAEGVGTLTLTLGGAPPGCG
jgi:hypothetical protein